MNGLEAAKEFAEADGDEIITFRAPIRERTGATPGTDGSDSEGAAGRLLIPVETNERMQTMSEKRTRNRR